MTVQCDDDCLSQRGVYDCVERFRGGRTILSNDVCSGCRTLLHVEIRE
jgi:hypothetical protein